MFRLYEALFHPINLLISSLIFVGAYLLKAGIFIFILPTLSLFLFSRITLFQKQVLANKKTRQRAHLQKKAKEKGWIFFHTYQNFQNKFQEPLAQNCPFTTNPILQEKNYTKAQELNQNFLILLNKKEQDIFLWDKFLALEKPSALKRLPLPPKNFFFKDHHQERKSLFPMIK